MKFKQITNILLVFFLLFITTSCNTGTTVDRSAKDYEVVDAWELSNENSVLSIHDYIVYDGGHSIQIINDGCGDLELNNSLGVEAEGEYEISIAFRRSQTDYDEDAPVDPEEEEDPTILIGENFSVIVFQPGIDNNPGSTLLDEEVEIELDLTWETKSLTFTAINDEPVTLTFRLGCDLKMFWIDIIEMPDPA